MRQPAKDTGEEAGPPDSGNVTAASSLTDVDKHMIATITEATEEPSELELTALYRQRLERQDRERRLVGQTAVEILSEAESEGLKIGGLSTATAARLRKEGVRLPLDVIDDALIRLDNARVILWDSERGYYELNRDTE